MAEWYLSYDNEQIGPLSLADAQARARSNPNGWAWREGLGEWRPIAQVTELSGSGSGRSQPPPRSMRSADDIDFKIIGAEMQFVEIELDPGESAVAEAGALMYKNASIKMESVFGDGSEMQSGSNFVNKLVGAGKRLITGESMFTTVFTHTGQGKAHVAFSAPYPGNIIPVTLANVGGSLICQRDSFLCAAKGVSIGMYLQKKILTALFGGEGFIMQRLDGDGMVFLHAGGTIVERDLQAGEVLHVDTGCVVGFQPSVNFEISRAGNIKTMLFGGEGIFLAVLTGPGKVWLQSLPFSRLAGRMLMASTGGKDETVISQFLQGS